MPTVEVDADSIEWPAMCCRCGGANFKIKPHLEQVVLWTTLSVTKYRQLALNIPVCNRCAYAQFFWFSAAAVIGGIGFLPIPLWNKVPDSLGVVFVAAVLVAFIGTRKRPIKIMKLDEKTNQLSLKIYDKRVAAALQAPKTSSRRSYNSGA